MLRDVTLAMFRNMSRNMSRMLLSVAPCALLLCVAASGASAGQSTPGAAPPASAPSVGVPSGPAQSASAPSSPASSAPALTLATTISPPLSEPGQDGMLDQIIRGAFARIGADVSLQQLPSERGLVMADNGQVDGDGNRISGLQATYPNLLQVPESNMTYEFTAFALRPDVNVRNWDDLRHYTVAYIIGWKIYDENVRASSTVKVATPENLFALLRAGRVDVVLYYRLGGLYYARKLGLPNLRVLAPPLTTREMYMYLNSRHADLVPRLADALRDMKKDGSYERIVAPFQSH
ncbi:MAG TPA: transporter substrate-binding domain-containing protein [Nitratidesulfovibrio sp.]|nr:transporter substrate-binding domain-containing protein [Nitratidesulfovibrio sp.]